MSPLGLKLVLGLTDVVGVVHVHLCPRARVRGPEHLRFGDI